MRASNRSLRSAALNRRAPTPSTPRISTHEFDARAGASVAFDNTSNIKEFFLDNVGFVAGPHSGTNRYHRLGEPKPAPLRGGNPPRGRAGQCRWIVNLRHSQ
jgi:hypothetical protein